MVSGLVVNTVSLSSESFYFESPLLQPYALADPVFLHQL